MPCEFSTVEVKQLWWFLDGAIMSPFTRERLAAAWGFCPRHTWAYLIAECELRLMPRGVLILYEDLAGRAATTLKERRWRAHLRATDICFTCEYLNLGDRDRIEPIWVRDAECVNRMVRTAQLVALDREHWEPRTCPKCLGGAGPLCRRHLLAAEDTDGSISKADRDEVAATLTNARRRMDKTLNAICWPRKPVQPGGWSALIEVLGWFAGWEGVAQIPPPAPQPDPERADLLYAGVGLSGS
jgi:hypothetical protein